MIEIVSYTPKEFWFVWWDGTHLGYFSKETNIELDVDAIPSRQFRLDIVEKLREYLK